MNHRHVFGVAAGNAVNRAEFTDAKGGQQRGRAVAATVTIGRIGGIEFISAADPGNTGMVNDAVEKLQVVVAGYAEQMADTRLVQTMQ